MNAFKVSLRVAALAGVCLASTRVVASSIEQFDTITEPGYVSQDGFGSSIALTDELLVVGMQRTPESGTVDKAFVYGRGEDGKWELRQALEPEEELPYFVQFGASVAIDGDTIAVSAPNPFDGQAGYVYLFELIEGTWQQDERILPPGDTPIFRPEFGAKIRFANGQLFVADRGDLTLEIFNRDGETWVHHQTLPLSFNEFATTDGFLFIGQGNADQGRGQVLVYEQVDGMWTETGTLTASDPEPSDRFGSSLSARGDRLAIGASNGDSPFKNDVGAIYVFELENGEWTEQGKAFPPSTSDGNNQVFGNVAQIDGNRLYVSANYSQNLEIYEWLYGSWVQTGSVQLREFYYVSALEVAGDVIMTGGQGAQAEEDDADVREFRYDSLAGLVPNFKALLFAEDAAQSDYFEEADAAFAYLDHLYAESDGVVESEFDTIEQYYGDAQRERVSEVESELDRLLALYGGSDEVVALGLDLHYYAAQAEAIIAGNAAREASRKRLGPPFAAVQPQDWIIDVELQEEQACLDAYEAALVAYFKLFSAAPGHEAGAAVLKDGFIALQPTRSYRPSPAILAGQDPEDPETLFNGYKDLVFVMQLLQKYGEAANRLAWLQLASGDAAQSLQTIDRVQRSLFVHGNLVLGMFPDLNYADATGSGLELAVAGWESAIGQLDAARDLAKNDVDPLGYENDFLMLTQRATFQQTQDYIYSSYDVYANFLDLDDTDSPLSVALADQQTAIDTYEAYRDRQDDLAEQYTLSTVSYESRLFEIVGARPDEPGYDNPGSVVGSELWQQQRNIESSRNRIKRNSTEMSNLVSEINIEIKRGGDVQETIIKYGDKQAKLTQKIAHIQAAQSFVDSLTNPAKWSKGGFVLAGINGLAQAGAEEGKAYFEGQKEKLAAEEDAKIEGINSDARVKTLWLQMNVLLIDSQEAALLYRQEVGRYQALLREKADLERRIAEREASLAKRYYADPIHRLVSNNAVVVSNNSFNEAQQWIFFMCRALEYKWNDSFSYDDGLKVWTRDSIYRCRNATELVGLYEAMRLSNEKFENTASQEDRFDWFSVKEDFFGLRETDSQGNPVVYYNPDTGEEETATEAFRRKLADATDSDGLITIRFNTVRQIPGGTFFLGPRYRADGSRIDSGLYLDRIRWMKIRVPGEHTTSRNTVSGTLRYGGTSFVRRQRVGVPDEERPDQVENEMTGYSTRYRFFDGDRFVVTDALTATVSMEKVSSSVPRLDGSPSQIDVLPSAQQIDSFRERSVAATDWQLVIYAKDQNVVILKPEEVDDIEIYFYHWAAERID